MPLRLRGYDGSVRRVGPVGHQEVRPGHPSRFRLGGRHTPLSVAERRGPGRGKRRRGGCHGLTVGPGLSLVPAGVAERLTQATGPVTRDGGVGGGIAVLCAEPEQPRLRTHSLLHHWHESPPSRW
jgi:hypothetical protein